MQVDVFMVAAFGGVFIEPRRHVGVETDSDGRLQRPADLPTKSG
jgi:hypothetical protein